MQFAHTHFTLGFRKALDHGIDYRDFQKVDRLPEGIPLMTIAGVWGDYSDIRCLFIYQMIQQWRSDLLSLEQCDSFSKPRPKIRS